MQRSRPDSPACFRCSISAAGYSGSLSDYIGRKNTYYTFFTLGIALYASAPFFAQIGSKALFVLAFGIILSMYGCGFATVPAYLADMFGTQFVGAVHGHMSPEEVAKLQAAHAKSDAAIPHRSFGIGKGGLDLPAFIFWCFVGIPLAWGTWKTLQSAAALF